MSFLWPGMLVLLLGVPFLVLGYLALVRRATSGRRAGGPGLRPHCLGPRRGADVTYRSPSSSPPSSWLVGFARPETSLSIPRREGTVILTFDVSNSMRANDLEPTRIDAAKAAARTFVERQPESIKIGVVAFSDGGLVSCQPTVRRRRAGRHRAALRRARRPWARGSSPR